jgi:hypothetical protein
MTRPVIPTAAKSAPPAAHRECRIYERHACGLETSCQPPAAWSHKEQKWPAQVRNISQGSLALVLRRRFEPGAGLALELPGPDPAEPSTVLVLVVRVSAQGNGYWLLGCTFVSHLSEEEVQALVQAANPHADEEPSGRLHLEGVDLEATLSGQVIHRRFKHLTLSDAWPLPAGAWLLLRTSRAPADHRGLRLHVDRCTQVGQRWRLRCTLHPADPADVALVLGESRR